MFKTLFKGSLILSFSGFILMCSSSPQSSSTVLTNFIEKVGDFTLKHSTPLLPTYYTLADCHACHAFPYQISLVAMSDYYDTLPNYATLLRQL